MGFIKLNKLSSKFIIPIVLVSIIILGSFLIYNISEQSKSEVAALTENGNALVDLLETAGKDSLWDYSEENIKNISDAVAKDKEVAIVAFYDANYKPMYVLDKKGKSPAYDDKYLRNFPSEIKDNRFAKTIMHGEDVAGYLEVVLSDYYIREDIKNSIISTTVQNGIILILLIILISLVTKLVIKSINTLSDATNVIASGDLTKRIEVKSKDEIGMLSKKFNDMTINLFNLVSKFNNTAHTLAASSEELAASVDNSIDIVKDISHNTSDIVNITKGQSEDIKTIETSVKSITEFFEDVTSSIDDVSIASIESFNKAKEGEESIQRTIENVEQINSIVVDAEDIINGLSIKSQAINSFVGLINDITSQTKLLSLNASIEAARSGEAGRGFAVVADEIKKLADQSDGITHQISDSVDEILLAISEAVEHMKKAPKAIEENNRTVKTTVKSLEEIMSSTQNTSDKLSVIKGNTHSQRKHAIEVLENIERITENSKVSVKESENILDRVIEQEQIVDEISGASTDLAKIAEELIEVSATFTI
ncbi:methyl-accepting chemotaxis protein [Helicovermis profundi]|uniref:Methyl-accepting chemotaxis protein n=1 Tax=Helicovermis profundi TaxID=3065157 RepID=A0AAU9E271_9FIRM|nr:hypothetical protein HLPR_07340 [Clostridia bacterium S502]